MNVCNLRKTGVSHLFLHSTNTEHLHWEINAEQNRAWSLPSQVLCQKGPSEVIRMLYHKTVPASRGSHNSHSTHGECLLLQADRITSTANVFICPTNKYLLCTRQDAWYHGRGKGDGQASARHFLYSLC